MKKDETKANIASESNCPIDIENATSLLGAASLVQKGNGNFFMYDKPNIFCNI